MRCEECPGVAAGAVARTMTTVIVAVASMIVMALAGCANPRGIESTATLAAPAALGADARRPRPRRSPPTGGAASTTRCSPT